MRDSWITSNEVEFNELLEIVERELEKLTKAQAGAFRELVLHGEAGPSAGAILGISPSRVRARSNSAGWNIRRKLEDRFPELCPIYRTEKIEAEIEPTQIKVGKVEDEPIRRGIINSNWHAPIFKKGDVVFYHKKNGKWVVMPESGEFEITLHGDSPCVR